jgi:hypothetical protein
MKNVTLGRIYRDSITNLTGTATAEAEYLGRESTDVRLEGAHSDGKPFSDWIDSSRLTTLKAPSAA